MIIKTSNIKKRVATRRGANRVEGARNCSMRTTYREMFLVKILPLLVEVVDSNAQSYTNTIG